MPLPEGPLAVEIDARSLLLGAGLFGMILGATLGMVAGASHRECEDAFANAGGAVCDDYATLRIAAFGMVGLSGIVALLPVASALRAGETGGMRLVWRR